MERLTGHTFLWNELDLVWRNTEAFEVLEPALYAVRYGPEFVDRLTLGRDDTFERFREAPRFLPGECYARLEFDGASLSGLPQRTPASVGLAAARTMASLEQGSPASPAISEVSDAFEAGLGTSLAARGGMRPFKFHPDDLIIGGPETFACAKAIVEAAKRIVVIHSAFIGRGMKHTASISEQGRGEWCAGVHRTGERRTTPRTPETQRSRCQKLRRPSSQRRPGKHTFRKPDEHRIPRKGPHCRYGLGRGLRRACRLLQIPRLPLRERRGLNPTDGTWPYRRFSNGIDCVADAAGRV